MPDSASQTTAVLYQLIQICRDGERGFTSAASMVDDLNLRRLFESYAQQRVEFAAELQLEAQRLAADPVKGTTLTPAVHDGADLKVGVAGREEGVVISGCEREEDQAVRLYQEAMAADLPGDLRSLVERQFRQVKEAHDHTRSLEQAHSRHG